MCGMAEYFYRQHYSDVISKHLTHNQKIDIAKRISELTLKSPIWQDKEKDYKEEFPEMQGINTKLSGLYLCAILKGIVDEMQGIKSGVLPI